MFDIKLLKEMMDDGFVVKQNHPEADIFIYNYTAKAQYDKLWNEVTLNCRGLIMDSKMNIIARPFPKFFNLGELENQHIPKEPFEVFEKMDGSLGILYWYNNKPYIATRGSFTSEQSVKANQILQTKYKHIIEKLNPTKTYLFEIIYPENRIVVDYGNTEDLVLLSVIDNINGKETLEDIGFPVVKRYNGITDINALQTLEEENKEGFVIRFNNGLRYKVKFKEYVRLHRIITQVSNISIWEYLRQGNTLDELLERVPDEFYNWVKKTNTDFLANYKQIENTAKQEFKNLGDRKQTALYFQKCTYPAILFNMLDGKNYSDTIWKMLRPKFSKTFTNSEE